MYKSSLRNKLTLSALIAIGSLSTMGFSNVSSNSMSFSAVVPLVCKVDYSPAQSANNVTQSGSAKEFCNNRTGYRVLARADGAANGTTLIVDGRKIAISANEEIEISNMNGPAVIDRTITLQNSQTQNFAEVSLRIVPK